MELALSLVFISQSIEGESVPMNPTQGLLKETSDTWYLWASAGVSLAVIIAVVALQSSNRRRE
jgi:hypothetical protein